jgi:predicted PolB exonuclease-like 3'-5' exonuclease
MVANGYILFDIETIPDGELLKDVSYSGENLTAASAIQKAQQEALEVSGGQTDFLPVSFHLPISVCAAHVNESYQLQTIACLDEPLFRPAKITKDFWHLLAKHQDYILVDFNGRRFDLPVLELAAFRFGLSIPFHFADSRFSTRSRYSPKHLDLYDWITNNGAVAYKGGLNLFSKILGKPGKMEVSGDQVWDLYQAGKVAEINNYCMFDVLDTYFVFLRNRVLCGLMDLEQEQFLVKHTHTWIEKQLPRFPHLQNYLDNWGDWSERIKAWM